jgi:hypothetical protein
VLTTDKIEDCVSSLITISRGDGTLQQKLGNAESRICGLLLEANPEVGGWFEVLKDLLDRLGNEINMPHGSTREFLDKVIDFIDGQLQRISVNEQSRSRSKARATLH